MKEPKDQLAEFINKKILKEKDKWECGLKNQYYKWLDLKESLFKDLEPKKLVRYNYSNEWHCPTCGSGNGKYEGTVGTHNYCHYCGQKLDWGND